MKKAFCFSLIAVIIALASAPALVKADDVSVSGYYEDSNTLTTEQISNLQNASLLIEYLRQGGTIDVKNTDSSYDVSDLLNDFGSFVGDVVGEIIDVVNPFQTEVEYHGLQPIRQAESSIIMLMGLLPFYALQEPENPTPTPSPDYIQYINYINGNIFYNTLNSHIDNFNNYSIVCANASWGQPSDSLGGLFYGNYSNIGFVVSPIIDIYINYDGNNYIVTHSTVNPQSIILNGSNYRNYGVMSKSNNGYDFTGTQNVNWNGFNFNYGLQTFSTLESAFVDIRYKYQNVNIYVDGNLWAYVGGENTGNTYNIELSTGSVTPENNGKVRWEYDTYIYYDIDLIEQELSLLLDEIRNLNHPTVIKFDDLQDVIVDVDGQPAIAVKVLADPRNIDKIYLDTYGPIIPAFLPLFTPVINDTDIFNIASTSVSPIPEELLEVFGYMFMGVLFIGFIHRLLE